MMIYIPLINHPFHVPSFRRVATIELSNQIVDYLRVFNSGKSLIESLRLVGESFMVDTQQVERRGMEVANMNGIFDDIVRKVVCLAIDGSGFGTAACHPHRKAPWMMIAPVVFFCHSTLRVDCSAEFAAPNN